MVRGSRRFVALAVGVVVVIVVVVVLAFVLLPPRQSGDVAVPANDATPEQVVTAYLAALDAHDCGTAEAVMTSDARDSAASWCDGVAAISNVTVRDHVMEPPRASGHSAPEEVAHVPVAVDLSWRPLHDDGSTDEGTTTWGYLLVRDSPDAAWRIVDQGTG